MREQGFACSGGSNEQDVRLGKFNLTTALFVQLDALVMVINGNGKFLLRCILANDILVQIFLEFQRTRQFAGRSVGGFVPVVLNY